MSDQDKQREIEQLANEPFSYPIYEEQPKPTNKTTGGIWVPCSERLPERHHGDICGDVFVRCADNEADTLYYRQINSECPFSHWLDTTVEIVTREEHEAAKNSDLNWAVKRWREEVEHRPLRNEYRRVLDDTWRQIIRQLGGNDIELCGQTHDSLLLQSQTRTSTESGNDD